VSKNSQKEKIFHENVSCFVAGSLKSAKRLLRFLVRFLPAFSDRLQKAETTLGSIFTQANEEFFEPTLAHAPISSRWRSGF
jgi:hypothetical protein